MSKNHQLDKMNEFGPMIRPYKIQSQENTRDFGIFIRLLGFQIYKIDNVIVAHLTS